MRGIKLVDEPYGRGRGRRSFRPHHCTMMARALVILYCKCCCCCCERWWRCQRLSVNCFVKLPLVSSIAVSDIECFVTFARLLLSLLVVLIWSPYGQLFPCTTDITVYVLSLQSALLCVSQCFRLALCPSIRGQLLLSDAGELTLTSNITRS